MTVLDIFLNWFAGGARGQTSNVGHLGDAILLIRQNYIFTFFRTRHVGISHDCKIIKLKNTYFVLF